MSDLFTLTNDKPRHAPTRFDNQPARQRSLLSGLDCLDGQLDLFATDGETSEQEQGEPSSNGADTDADKIARNRSALISDLANELQRVNGFSRRARMRGKRSRAEFNKKAIGGRYGIAYHGYSPLDAIAGSAIWGTFGNDCLDAARMAVDSFLNGVAQGVAS